MTSQTHTFTVSDSEISQPLPLRVFREMGDHYDSLPLKGPSAGETTQNSKYTFNRETFSIIISIMFEALLKSCQTHRVGQLEYEKHEKKSFDEKKIFSSRKFIFKILILEKNQIFYLNSTLYPLSFERPMVQNGTLSAYFEMC